MDRSTIDTVQENLTNAVKSLDLAEDNLFTDVVDVEHVELMERVGELAKEIEKISSELAALKTNDDEERTEHE